MSPSVLCTLSSGIGLSIPPSIKLTPFQSKGSSTLGIETDALIASFSLPLLKTTSFWLSTSVATALKGIGKSSIRISPINLFISLNTLIPLINPCELIVKSINLNTSNLSSSPIQFLYSFRWPAAYIPPTTEPIEQPEIDFISKFWRISSSITPI